MNAVPHRTNVVHRLLLLFLFGSFQKGNWMRELKMWCPVIRAVRMGGTKDERLRFEQEYLPVDPATGKLKWDVLVTSYEGMLKQRSKLAKIKWRYLIIDEAHRIKNENSSLSKAVRMVDVDHRLLITGTPLQVRIYLIYKPRRTKDLAL